MDLGLIGCDWQMENIEGGAGTAGGGGMAGVVCTVDLICIKFKYEQLSFWLTSGLSLK